MQKEIAKIDVAKSEQFDSDSNTEIKHEINGQSSLQKNFDKYASAEEQRAMNLNGIQRIVNNLLKRSHNSKET